MRTVLLDRTTWDLVVDASRNIAVASDPYAMAQDVASAIRLFQGELWYNTVPGVPYWASILGKMPPMTLFKSKMEAAALTVPGVVSAKCFIASFSARQIKGQVQFTDSLGRKFAVGF